MRATTIDLYESIISYMRPYDYSVEIYSTNNLFYHNIVKVCPANGISHRFVPAFINASEIYDSIPSSITLVIVDYKPKNI